MNKPLIILIFLAIACGHTYPPDPNAVVVVTVKEPGSSEERLVLPHDSSCSPQFKCGKNKGADCAAALYRDALKYISEGKSFETKKLYLTARVSYLQAMCRLVEAEIRINDAKTTNYKDWKMAVVMGLEKKIKEKIKLCRRKNFLLEWRR
tara:strand:- start:47 stop:496 length:450 start_codon:yes stop_codon:yes gene_type:complete